MSKDQKEIIKLISFVRKHESYIGDRLNKIYNPYETIDIWANSCNIDKGTHAVKAFVLHRDYKEWCKANFYQEKLIAKCKTFNSVMKEVLNYKINKRNVIFYVNKKVEYEPSKKNNDGQRASKKRKKEKV